MTVPSSRRRPDIEDGMATATQFRARVVSIIDGEPTRHEVDHAEPHTIIEVEPEAELWLVVAKLSLLADFPIGYKVAFFPQPDFPEESEPDTASPPMEDTGFTAPRDTGEAEVVDTGTAPSEEDTETPPPSVSSAFEQVDADGEEKSGCTYIHVNPSPSSLIWLLAPLLFYRRRDAPAQ